MTSSVVFLDNVQCTGNETSLLGCIENGSKPYRCGDGRGAGVRCGGIVSMLEYLIAS